MNLSMKYLFALAATCIAFVTGSSSPNAVLQLPEKPAGQPMGTFLDELFSDDSTTVPNTTLATAQRSHQKRSYSNSWGLHQSVWDNETDGGLVTYNISVDFSNCGHGITFETDIGVYTFTNGTTSNECSFRDLLTDQWRLRSEDKVRDPWNLRYPGTDRPINTNYANHTGVLAQLALDEGTQVLNNGLICKRAPGAATDPNLVNELRHLLANTHSYWTAVVLNTVLGGFAGAGIAAIHDLAFKGNVSAENVVQTGFVIATVVMMGGILNRCHEVDRLDGAQQVAENMQMGAVRVAENVANLVPGGREAVVQNVMIAWARRAIGRIRRRQIERAVAAVAATPGSGPNTPLGCLTEAEARAAAGQVGEMVAQELEMVPMREIVEEMANVGESGACNAV